MTLTPHSARRLDRKITLNDGELMPAWFDMLEGDHSKRTKDGTEDEAGMNESLADLKELIEIERTQFGISPERIVVGGFCKYIHFKSGYSAYSSNKAEVCTHALTPRRSPQPKAPRLRSFRASPSRSR